MNNLSFSIRILVLTFFLFTSNSLPQFRWGQTNGPFGGSAQIVIADSSGNLYAGGYGGIYYSIDDGETWAFHQIISDLNQTVVYNYNLVVTICPADKDTIYAGTYQYFFRSTDKMKTWAKIEGLEGNGMYSKFAIHPDNGYMYAVGGNGLYRSTDNGTNWTNLVSETGTEMSVLKILSSGEIFIAFEFGGELLKSVDYGMNWIKADSGYSIEATSTFMEDNEGNIYTAGDKIFKSSDKGENWAEFYTPDFHVLAMASDASNNIYAGGTGGNLVVTTDSGKTWDKFYSGKNYNQRIFSMLVNEHYEIFMHVDEVGFLKSTDKGVNWKEVGFPESSVTDIVVNKSNNIIAGTSGNGPYISSDLGQTWHATNFNVEWPVVHKLFISDSNDIIMLDFALKIWFSSDAGQSWHLRSEPYFEGSIHGFILNNSGRMIINWAMQNKYYSSDDYGKTWNTFTNLGNIGHWIGFDKYPPSNLYIGRGSIISYSNDDGLSWKKNNCLPGELITVLRTDRNGTLYRGSNWGIFKSKDSLKTWIDLNNGLPSGNVISIDTYKNDGVVCVIENKGAFVSSNGGGEWEAFEPTKIIVKKAVFDSSGYIFASTEYNGVLKSNKHLEVISQVINEKNLNYALMQNYPNPFNPVTTISYSIPVQSNVELKVYDMLGREVTTLVNKEQSSGKYNVQFDATSLPSGIYIYSINAGNYKSSRKLVLLK